MIQETLQGRRVAITGATGFLGTALVERLLRAVPGSELVLVVSDPDAPGGTFVHWTSWNGAEGTNSFGKTGYSGPCPPRGAAPHRYVVTVYLLRRRLGLPAGSPPEKVLQAVQKLATASGSTTGFYGR